MALGALAAAVAVLAAADPNAAFVPGEETILEVTYLRLPAGEARIVVGHPEGKIWPVTFQARTAGVTGVVDVREHLVSYWDAEAQLPRGSDLRAVEAGDQHLDQVRFDRVNGTATLSVDRGGRRKVRTFAVPAGVHELTSAFLWLRLQRLEPGARYELPVSSGSSQFTLVAEVVGREELETPAGRFRTLRVKIRSGLTGHFAMSGDGSMWLSDDARHLLVRAEADFAVGSIVATVTRYRPGVPPEPVPTEASTSTTPTGALAGPR